MVAILVTLASVFGSPTDAAIIMLNLPLVLAGRVVGVWLSGRALSIASMIGLIAPFGIARRNGIMLVSHIAHLRDEESVRDHREAIVRGALERLAPILTTAQATGLALVPVTLGMGEPGTEIQAPMALVILVGLFSATALNNVGGLGGVLAVRAAAPRAAGERSVTARAENRRRGASTVRRVRCVWVSFERIAV